MGNSPFQFKFFPSRCRVKAGTICLFTLSMSILNAADIPVTTINDSGTGSLRAGLSAAVTGDTLDFQPALNGLTLTNSGSSLTVGNAVTFLDSSSITLTDSHAYSLGAPLTVNWAGNLTLNGILSDSTATGAASGSMLKSGVGTLNLSGTNTYSGGTSFTAGTIDVTNSKALGTGTLTANNAVINPILILGNGTNLANAISLQSTLVVNTAASTTSTLSGVISGTAAASTLNQIGTGTLILSGANTFVGGVHVTNNSTIDLQSNAGLGTGSLKVSGALTLNLTSGVSASNAIALSNNITTNVDSSSATLSGNITETVSSSLTKTGAGTLILSGTNAYTNGTTVSQGTLQGNTSSLTGNIVNNSSLIFNQSTSGTYSGNISGTGTLSETSSTGLGTLIFSGNSILTTTTAVNSGELQVTGSISGPVSITSTSGLLSGTGTVGGVINDGLVQPGTSSTIGTLHVNGNYTQQSAGEADFKINSSGTTPGVNNDYLNVSGQSQLAGNLKVLLQGGGFASGTNYTVVNSATGISGNYALASTNSSAWGVDMIYGANNVTIQLEPTTSLAAAATTANQRSVGTALDSLASSSTGDLFAMINSLSVQPAAQQRQSLNQLSGEFFGNMQTLGLQVEDQFQQRVTGRLVSDAGFLMGGHPNQADDSDIRGQSPMYDSTKTWMQGYGVGGRLRSDGNGASANYSQGGALYAVDWGDEIARLGIVGGNSYARMNDGFSATGQLTSYQIGTYALSHSDVAYVLGTMNYGNNSFIANRAVTVSTFNQSIQTDYSGYQLGANVESGLKLTAGLFHIQPLIGLQYLFVAQQGFNESGGPAALTVSRSQASSLRANIGARVAVDQFEGPGGTIWTPYLQARFVSEMLDNDRIVSASFNGAPTGGAFASQGTGIGYNYGIITKGIQVVLNDRWTLFGGAELMFGQRITTETGSIAATLSF